MPPVWLLVPPATFYQLSASDVLLDERLEVQRGLSSTRREDKSATAAG